MTKADYLQENQAAATAAESQKAPISNVSSVVKSDDGNSGQDNKHDNDDETQSTNEQRSEPGISSYVKNYPTLKNQSPRC